MTSLPFWELLPIHEALYKLSGYFFKYDRGKVSILLVRLTASHDLLELNELNEILDASLNCDIVAIKLDHIGEIFVADTDNNDTERDVVA